MNFSISAYPTPKKMEKIAKDLVLMDSKVFFLESGCVAEKSTFHRFEFNLVFFFFFFPLVVSPLCLNILFFDFI